MLASIYFSSFCLAVKVNENPTMGGDGDGEEVTFEEGDDVEEEDADIDAVSVLLILLMCYIDGEVQMKPNCYTFRKLQVVWT